MFLGEGVGIGFPDFWESILSLGDVVPPRRDGATPRGFAGGKQAFKSFELFKPSGYDSKSPKGGVWHFVFCDSYEGEAGRTSAAIERIERVRPRAETRRDEMLDLGRRENLERIDKFQEIQ